MTRQKNCLRTLLVVLWIHSTMGFTQINPEDIAMEDDAFEDAFYESLKQKGIENYDKAVTLLEKCVLLEPENPVLYNELGRNYLKQKDYKNAINAFEKAIYLDSSNKWYWVGLYDVYYEMKDYNNSIPVVKKLIEFKDSYKEDLVALYMYTSQFDKALELINELEATVGKSKNREAYKLDILKDIKYKGIEKEQLEIQIKKYPKEESNYISLIYLYSESNQEEKAFAVAKELEKAIPESDLVHVTLFKYYIDKNEGDNAVRSMNRVLTGTKIDEKIKHKIVNEFLIFANKNDGYDTALEKAITDFDKNTDILVIKEVGKFYYRKKNWEKAIYYLELSLKSEPDDIESISLLLYSYLEMTQYTVLLNKAELLLEKYPMLPELYYYAGLASNKLHQYKKSKDFLEAGLDYLVEDTDLEIQMNIQLNESYIGLGQSNKGEKYLLRAKQLSKKN